MKALKNPVHFVTQMGELIRPKNEQERQAAGTAALIIAAAGVIALFLYYLT